MRSSSVLSCVCGISGWVPFFVSLLAAVFETGKTNIAIWLGIAAAIGLVGLALGVSGVRRDRSSSGGVLALLGITLCVMVLGASAVWGLLEFAR